MYIYSSFRFFLEEPCFQPRLSLMHPRSILFDGKFRLGNIFPGNKHALRLFSSDNIPSPSITELLSKQRWNKLKSHLQNVSPSTLLQQLLDSKTDPDLTLRYFRWSEKEFNLSHSLELSCKLLHSLANAKREGNLRAALNVRTQMEKDGRRANVVTYNVLIKGFCKKGKLEDANGLLNEMLEKGLIPNRTTYEIVKEEMVEKGFVPDIEGHLYSISAS
ncbi:hypothetical protein QUC31_009376 [Theobroma cacao]